MERPKDFYKHFERNDLCVVTEKKMRKLRRKYHSNDRLKTFGIYAGFAIGMFLFRLLKYWI